MSLRPALSAALLVPCLAAAAELGRLTVLSGVGEPLRAEIEIVAVRPGEAAGLGARIPPPEVFWRANLEPAPVLDELRVAVERRPQGRYVIAVRSSGPIADPFIQLLVELTSPAGSVVREYPFLLEEPRARRPRAATAAAPSPQPELPVEEVSPPVAAPGDGYVVKPGDTLAVIAETARPPGVTLEQMIVALYQANEQAFVDRNMNRLRARETLAVPAEDAARTIEPAAARSIILEHRAAFDDYRRRLAGTAAVGPGAADAPGATAAAATSSRAAGDRLRLSRGDERKPGGAVAAAREDDLTALHHALGETKERIAALEKNVGDMTTLLTLRNGELARPQRDARATGQALAPMPRDAEAAGGSPDPSGRSALARLLDEYGAWLMVVLLAFLSWILMPFKTLRLWLKKRRRQARKARKAAERVRRAARDAGLLPSSA
jgi:pilus assembly protein FimV